MKYLIGKYERYYPLVFAVVISLIFYFLEKKIDNLDETVKRLLDAALAICGALLGFLLTILTLINTIETRRMRFVKESGLSVLLNHYLKVALYSNIVSISIYFLLPILFSLKGMAEEKEYVYSTLVFIVAFTWLSNIRFATIFVKLLTDPKP